jgi:DNA-binding transcriptional ArsR family regulator
MVDQTYILAPQVVKVRFEVNPAFSGIEGIRELNEVDRLSGFGEWVTRTAAALPAERRDLNKIVFMAYEAVFFDIMPVMFGYDDFPSYVEALAARDPYELRDQVLPLIAQHYNTKIAADESQHITAEQILNDEQWIAQLMTHLCESYGVDPALTNRAAAFYTDPPQMHATVVEHLRWMWDNVMAEEWERSKPLLYESVAAFERLDFSNMTAHEAARIVTTRDLRATLEKKGENIETVVFVPSAHLGPYVVNTIYGSTLFLTFGARLPRNAQVPFSALSRSELLTRLNGLADDTRLRILELLTQHEELCAQDIIERLNLSQSSVSRHLSQLSANGFITERRREVAKCYSLNTDRVIDTLRTLTNFLSRP